MPQYNLVLLDADGTLFDYVTVQGTSLKQVFRHHGFAYGDDVKARFREINSSLWEEFEKGTIEKDVLQVERWRRLLGERRLTADPGTFNEVYLDYLSEGSFLLEGALEVCEELSKHCALAIASNGIARVQRSRLANSPIRPYIRHLIVSEDAGYQKPHRGFFEYAFSVCGHSDKSTAIMVGDSLGADMKGGAEYGITTCWYNPAGHRNNSGIKVDYEIRDLRELIKLIT